jgi:thioredoxin-like negative regulator of GroEL
MTPIVDGVEAAYQGQLKVQRINANQGDGPAIMKAYRIQGHPTLLIFDRDGHEAYRLIGPRPAEEIKELLDEVLNIQH